MKTKELNNKSEIVFHLENEEGKKMSYGMSITKIQELCEDYVYDGIQSSCLSSSCNNKSQNFCDCAGDFEDFFIKSLSVKHH